MRLPWNGTIVAAAQSPSNADILQLASSVTCVCTNQSVAGKIQLKKKENKQKKAVEWDWKMDLSYGSVTIGAIKSECGKIAVICVCVHHSFPLIIQTQMESSHIRKKCVIFLMDLA